MICMSSSSSEVWRELLVLLSFIVSGVLELLERLGPGL